MQINGFNKPIKYDPMLLLRTLVIYTIYILCDKMFLIQLTQFILAVHKTVAL